MKTEIREVSSPVRALALGVVGVVSSIFVVGALVTREQPVARASETQDLARLLEEVAAPVRAAWLVRTGSPGELVAVDALGRETRFERRDDQLLVQRPGGPEGVLLRDVRNLHFDTRLVRRLREAPARSMTDTFWERRPSGEGSLLPLQSGDQLALGFTVPVDAPDAVSSVPGVQEQFLACRVSRVHLPLRMLSDASGGALQVSLHEGLVKDEARPVGPPLARTRVALSALPSRTAGPDEMMTLDLSALQARQPLEPGRSYVLVLEPVGVGLSMAVCAVSTPRHSGIALQAVGESDWQEQALRVPMRLDGPCRFTQTRAHEVVERVDLSVVLTDGRAARLPMVIAGQSAAMNSWLGAVPGELPVLAGGEPAAAHRLGNTNRLGSGR